MLSSKIRVGIHGRTSETLFFVHGHHARMVTSSLRPAISLPRMYTHLLLTLATCILASKAVNDALSSTDRDRTATVAGAGF